MPWILAAFVALFAVADRLAGGDYIHNLQTIVEADAKTWRCPRWVSALAVEIVNARSTFWASVALAALLAVVGAFSHFGPRLALLALSFAAWRWEGWAVFGGAIDPKTNTQRLGLFERHLLVYPAFLPALIWLGHAHWFRTSVVSFVLLGVFTIWATILGAVLAAEEGRMPNLNASVEAARGAVLGLFVAAALMAGA